MKTSHYFFKILIGEWTTKLRIPRLFVSSFNLTPKTVMLADASSERLWMVDMEEEEEDNHTELYFKRGWTKFVKDHDDLEAADFLIFKFDGMLRFKVIICGKSACEKKFESEARERMNQNLNIKQHRNNNKQTAAASTRDRRENQKGKDHMDVDRVQKPDVTVKEEEVGFDYYGTSGQETWDDAWESQSEDEEEEDDDDDDDDYDYNEEEVEEEKEGDGFDDIEYEPQDSTMNIGEGSNLGFTVPSFRVYLQPAYAKRGCMCVPTEFFKRYMREEKQEVEIETVRGVWKVTLLPHKKRTRTFARFSKGWSEFARMNQFETGQSLLFRMIQGGECPKFVVHITRNSP